MKKFDIFISYRRAGGFEVADSVYQRLVAKHYSAFLDMEQLNAGTFNTKLLDVIDGCKDFILILPPHALDRCNDEEDWVRREVEHAIKGGKNIIPIMLRGFEWPAKEALPESLRELPNYNGITAADHNVYVENIERLKHNFLTSHPIPWWKRYKRYLFVLLFVLLAALATGVVMKCTEDKAVEQTIPAEYEAICKEYASQIMGEYLKMDNNFAIVRSADEFWNKFLDDCAKGKYDREELVSDLHGLIEGCRKDLMAPGNVELSEEDMAIMRAYYPSCEELSVLQTMVDEYYKKVNDYLDQLKFYSNNEYPTQYRDYFKKLLESVQVSLEFNYIDVLAICSDMPKSVEEVIMDLTGVIAHPISVVIGQSKAAYDKMLEVYGNRLIDINRSISYFVNEFGGNASALDEIDSQIDLAYAALDECIAMCQEAFVVDIESTDDISSAWDKICRLATATAMMDECAELVSAKLYEYCNVMDEARMEHDIMPDEVFNLEAFKANNVKPAYGKLYVLLAQYKELNPNNDKYIADYIASAEMYYAGVSLGYASAEAGLLVFATGGDEEHPVIKVGDIIVEVDGKPIATYEDYDAARGARDKAQPAKVMRIGEDKSMGVVEVTLPVNSTIELGFLPLYM